MGREQASDSLRQRAFIGFGRAVSRLDPGRLADWVDLGLTMTQLRVLFLLREEDGAAASVLAERLSVDPSTLTRIVDRLVRHGLVRRENDDGDRRLVRHLLTERGARSVAELERNARDRLNRVMDRLSEPQLERLVVALEDLSAALDAQEAEELAGVET
jgi:DNA-binding MarR family transcriptional regulator